MRLIDGDAAIDALNKMKIYRPLDSDRYVISDCMNKIANLPSAQPELIRCKDCKYSSPNGVYGCRLERYNFNDESVRMYGEDYCSCGERRTDDT